MDDHGGGNEGGSFKVKHAAEVKNVHEAGAGEVGNVVAEKRCLRFNLFCSF